MIKKNGFFTGREHRKLFYQYWLPEGDIKLYLIALHSWGKNSDFFQIPAEYFTEKGYALYAFDLRGHYRNAGDFPGHIDSMDHIQKDLDLFEETILKDAGNKKIFLIGDSLGGLISLQHAINDPNLSGIIVCSPLVDLSLNKDFGKKGLKKMSKMPATKLVPYIIDQKELTSDLKILRSFLGDKNRLNTISAKSALDIDDSLKLIRRDERNLQCPILFLEAGNDNLTDKVANKKFFDNIGSKDKTFKEYDDFFHALLFEKMREQVYQDIFIWLEKKLRIFSI